MNLNELKITGNNKIHLTDSLETSLLSFKLTLTESAIIPDNNKFMIYVSKEENVGNVITLVEYLQLLNLRCFSDQSVEMCQ